MQTYDNVYNVFESKDCKLLTTREEFNNVTGRFKKYKYIASCGHEHEVFYNVFKSRNTGVICPKCVIKENSKKAKDKYQIDKTHTLKLEKHCIDYFMDMVKDDFECIKAFDGCKTDIIIRPQSVQADKWVGIQVKSTAYKNMDYGFTLTTKNYDNLLILCMCWEDKRTWLFPFADVKHLTKITIGLSTSKYSTYELTDKNIKTMMTNYYDNNVKQMFDILDTPINIYQQREKLFKQLRELKVDFLKFVYSNIEGEVYDFQCKGLKVQEKVGCIHKKGYLFTLCKRDGKKTDKSRNFTSYKEGDNDIYWFHCLDKTHFYVIPETVLVNDNKINTEGREHLYLTPLNSNRYSTYMFNYDNIDKDRLQGVFKNNTLSN